MSKAVVMMDMPDNCYGCDFSSSYMCTCRKTGKILEDTKYKMRPEWCPLKTVSIDICIALLMEVRDENYI